MDNPSPNIGAALRRARIERDLSLDETAKLTSVSKAMLGQIERGESSPTISTMWKIASGLHLTFSALMGGVSGTYSSVELSDLQPMYEAERKMALYNVFPFDPIAGFEYFYIELKPGCQCESATHPNVQEEYIIVTQGCLELTVNKQVFQLKTGASIKFKGCEKHIYNNPFPEMTVFQNIMRY